MGRRQRTQKNTGRAARVPVVPFLRQISTGNWTNRCFGLRWMPNKSQEALGMRRRDRGEKKSPSAVDNNNNKINSPLIPDPTADTGPPLLRCPALVTAARSAPPAPYAARTVKLALLLGSDNIAWLCQRPRTTSTTGTARGHVRASTEFDRRRSDRLGGDAVSNGSDRAEV